jgi:histone-lysine N-methyltransferase SETD3
MEVHNAYSEHSTESAFNERQKAKHLLKWMGDHDAVIPLIAIEQIARDYRGVCLTKAVPAGALVCSIPVHLLITYETAHVSRIGQMIKTRVDKNDDFQSQVYVACMLLEERCKGQSSYWAHYLDMLPASYSCIPIMFTSDELMYLNGSLVEYEIQSRRQSYLDEYKRLNEATDLMGKYSLDDYIWARLVVRSRIFGITIGAQRTAALVPIADMLNHKTSPDTCWTFDQVSNSFTLVSLTPLEANQQIFDSYGRKSRSTYLMNYGFIPDDLVDIHEIDDLDECLIVIKKSEVPQLDDDLHFRINQDLMSRECKILFQVIRQITAAPSLTSIEHEVRVINYFQTLISYSLSKFNTTIEADILLLRESKQKNRNITNAVRAVLTEKQLLQWYYNLCPLLITYWTTDINTDQECTQFTEQTLMYLRSIC